MINKPTVLITRKIPANGIEILRSRYNLIINMKDRPLNRKELIKNVKDIDAILCTVQDRIDKQIIDIAGSNLKVISTFSTGYEHIDTQTANKKGIRVAYTGNTLTETTADLAFGLIVCLARRIVEADKFVRDSKWKNGWCPELMLGTDIHNKVLGLIGFGKIGKAVAKRAMGFDMEVIYHKRNVQENDRDKNTKGKAKYCKLKELLSIADYIVIACSLNEDSYHLIDIENLKIMKKTAFLINISRGKIIKERDLVFALRNKCLAGAALDVFEREPILKSNPLIKMKNVILLPHIGSSSHSTRDRMSEIAATNIVDVLDGNDKNAILVE